MAGARWVGGFCHHVHGTELLVYNAINIQLGPYQLNNSTFPGVGIATLWCPSDGVINGLRFYEVQAGWDGTTVGICYTSYRGVCGTFMQSPEQCNNPWRPSKGCSPTPEDQPGITGSLARDL